MKLTTTQLITIGRAAEIADVSRETIQQWITEGLPIRVVAGTVVINQPDLEQWRER